MSGEDAEILIHHEPPLGWITINRPAARNALTAMMWERLASLVTEFGADESIRVIILRGAGQQSFISGVDIAELQQLLQEPDRQEENYRFTLRLLEAIASAPKPVLAMINGHCLGGGMLIALTCDLRLSSERAQFAIPAVKLGVAYPPDYGVARLVWTVGAGKATELLLTGNTVDAAEARRIGLVQRVVAAEQLEEATRQYALSLSRGAPLTLAAHKLALQQVWQTNSLADEVLAAIQRCYRSTDCQEGLTAFLEKRPPVFIGE
ncbi:MAG: enoyl-CoA hydratase-related protein [Blastocatellia bacterium]